MKAAVKAGLVGGVCGLALVNSIPVFAQQDAPVTVQEAGSPAPPAAAPAAEPAPAQPASTAGGLQDIVVTARRKEENLQNVPIAVTAIGSEGLQRQQITDSRSLLAAVPGIAQPTRLAGNPNVTALTRIRGVPGVSTYFGGAPSVNAQYSYYAPFFDVQSVQVLKGPQGTLFGQASNAGAIVIEPNKPGNAFAGNILAEAGSYGRRNVEGAIDIPLVEDRILIRLAGKSFFRDGYIKDTITGAKFGQEDYKIARGTIVIKPTDTIENTTLVQGEWDGYIGQNASTLGDFNFAPASQLPLIATQAALNGMTLEQWNTARDQALATQLAIGPYKTQGYSTVCPGFTPTPPGPDFTSRQPSGCPGGRGTHKAFLLVNTTQWEVANDITLKNIASLSWGSIHNGQIDGDQTRLLLRQSNPLIGVQQKEPRVWSDELQMNGKFGDLDLTAGAFYFQSKQKPEFDRPTYAPFLTNFNTVATTQRAVNTNKSVYAQGTYDLSGWLLEGLSFTGGLRYSHDKAEIQTWVVNPTTFEPISSTGGPGSPAGEASWGRLSYTTGFQYQMSPRTMGYVTLSKGNRTGGLQNIPGQEQFDPDTLTNLEAGIKASFDVGPWSFRTNGSAFYGWFKDVQVSQILLVPIPGTNSSNITQAVTNAAAQTIYGFDGEFEAALNRSLQFRAYLSMNDQYYTKYPTLDRATLQIIDVSDTPIANSPKTKAGFSATYHLPLDEDRFGDVSFGVDFQYQAGFWASVSKPLTPTDPNNPTTGAVCKVRRTAANGYGPLSADGGWAYKNCVPANHNVNLNFNWDRPMGAEGLRASLTVTNVTGFSKPQGTNNNYDSVAYESYLVPIPRSFIFSVGYRF